MSTQIWQKELLRSIRSLTELKAQLTVDLPYPVNTNFPIKITPLYFSLINKNNPYDPLLLQVISPKVDALSDFSEAPLKELEFNPLPGLLHKYAGRVLVMLTGACMIHCQYCFRQHFSYQDQSISKLHWQNIINYIKNDVSIFEVILSGGDPLVANNNMLKKTIDSLANIAHLTTVRIHTRVPSVLPNRIDNGLLEIFSQSKLKIILVTHINHPNELCDENMAKIDLLSKKTTLLNQSVLLHKVNDNYDTLAQLSKQLIQGNIMPYYLHQLDPVSGAEFYNVSDTKACEIHQQLVSQLPGYMVPKLVREIPDRKSKSALT
tara:strand:- start:817 stop:1776 length:960 start_codon:yes stop_codon:yes gene_type:complete